MKKFFFLICLSFSFSALADILIEPLAGLNFNGGYKEENASEEDMKGSSYGGRLGYHNLGFQVGLDYLHSNLDIENAPKNLVSEEWAGFIGFRFPVFVRIYAGYIFSAMGEIDELKLEKGSGSKIGIGFTGLPFVNINLEFRSVTFSESTTGTTTIETDTSYTTYFIGLSVPLIF
jgi:hypothetical protein